MNRGRGSVFGRVSKMCDHVAGKIMPLRLSAAFCLPWPIRFIRGSGKVKHSQIAIHMVSALRGVYEAKCSDTARNSILNSGQTQFEFTHCGCDKLLQPGPGSGNLLVSARPPPPRADHRNIRTTTAPTV